MIKLGLRLYKLPKSTKDIKLKHFIAFEKEHVEYKEDPKDQFEAFERIQMYLKCFSALSAIPYDAFDVIENPFDMYLNPMGQMKKVFDHFEKLIPAITYNLDKTPTKVINGFYFGRKWGLKRKWNLFDFGERSVRKMAHFENEWKEYFNQAVDDVINLKFESLPRLIAIVATEKGEKTKHFEKNLKIKEKLFEELPLSVAYQIVDYFFFNSPKLQPITQPFGVVASVSKGMLRSTTSRTTDSKAQSTKSVTTEKI